MYVYIKKLFDHDITGQISFTKDVAIHFFNASEKFLKKEENINIHIFHFSNKANFQDIEIQPATDYRFSSTLNTFINSSGQSIKAGDLLYIEKISKSYGVKIISSSDANYSVFNALLNESDRHFLLCNDDLEDKQAESETSIKSQKKYKDLLLRKKNIVLTGAPGTGKTFLSKAVAAHIIGATSWDELTPEQKEHVGFVQFHPSYDYTDFVEGLRPAKDGIFIRQDGVFKAFCKKAITSKTFNLKAEWDNLLADVDSGAIAELTKKSGGKVTGLCVKNGHLRWEDTNGNIASNGMSYKQLDVMYRKFSDTLPEKVDDLTPTGINTQLWAVLNEIHKRRDSRTSNDDPFVFIIDEINRGELSKIFGELFYSIEPDYRGESGRVRTQYNNMVEEGDVFAEGFYIPENVYIIGTMNDVDRGVEAMDFAIRRRFAWAEVTAKESAENMGITGLAAKKMEALNKALESQGLSSAYHIGGAYFRKLEGDDYKSLWEYHLKGIISEYFRGEPDYETKIKEIEDAYNSVVEKKATDSTDTQDGAEPTESAETGNSEE